MADQIPFGVVEHILTKLVPGVSRNWIHVWCSKGDDQAQWEAGHHQGSEQSCSQNWVRKLNGVVYDADDLLDDYATHYLQRGGLARQVSDFFSSENQVAFRLNMSHRLKDIKERIDDIEKEIHVLNLIPRGTVHTRVESSWRETHSFVLTSEILGREENKKEIIGSCCRPGALGLGKTTLAQWVYNEERVVNHFEFKIWACISDDSGDGFDVNIQKRYLLVLDDVWNQNPQKWDHVRTLLMVGAIGSKIVVTTRKPRVASLMGDNFPINLKGLDENDSCRLFSKSHLKMERRMCIQTSPKLEKKLQKCVREFLSLLKCSRVLKLSYDNLPTHLRQCFTYCALFPKDYEIEKKLVVQLWIAQAIRGYRDQYFEELLSRSLLEKARTNHFTNTLSCKMHDLIHDLAQSIVGSDILVLRSDVNNIPEEARHVSLFEEVNPMIKALKGKPIRTFLNLGEDSFKDSTIVNSFFRVLCVYKVPKCLGKLSHLRYLDLSYNDFKVLPNAITRLKNLQTLKLTGCRRLKGIPDNIGELINLRHLENSGCDDLTHMPHGIGKLTLLQSLPLFVVGNDIGLRNHKIGSLSELKGLNQLRGGLCISNLQNVRDVELVSRGEILKGKQYLQSLRLEWNQWDQDGGLQPHPHPYLKHIFIKGYGGTEFPSWMMNDGMFKMQNSATLFSTPSLESLKLHNMEELVDLKEGPLTTPLFPSLESLRLSYVPKLKELWRMDLLAEEGPSFYHLSKLDIYKCSDLASLHPSPSLSQLRINDCPNLTSMELPSSHCLSELDIGGCPNLASFKVAPLPSLKTLFLQRVRYGCPNLQSLELHSSPCLSRLTIDDCPNLTSMELPSSLCLSELDIGKCPNLASFKVAPLPSLETLSLFTVRYGVIWQIMSVSASSSLKSLYIESIDDMISLPKELLQHVSGLVTLQIRECPNLQSLELPSSHCLSKLKIIKCPNLASFNVASLPRLEELSLRGVRAEVLRQLMFVSASSSLKSLGIWEIDGMISLPEEPLQYVSTLETLYIVKCSGLATLLHWMGSLSSLTELIISGCSELTSLPEEIYSFKKLQTFYFCGYPDLEERYNKETGKDRAKIAHIPHVRFDIDFDMHVKVWYDNSQSLELHSSPSLSRLTIHDCPNLTSMELPSSLCLSELDIRKCPNLASFKVAPLPSLETLSLFTVRYGVIWQIMSVSASSSSLKSLCVESIDDMISLPKELLQHVSGLVTLQIRECPNLQSLELPSSHCLSKLKIIKCPNLASFNVASLPRLEELSLRGVRAEVLRQFMFVSASSSLKSLRICEIDDLEERYNKETGKDRAKIAHIPRVRFKCDFKLKWKTSSMLRLVAFVR
ncbi:hypothetical protein AAG906_019013 [Vitis piasezkii]